MCAFARTPFWESQKEKRIGYFFCQKKSLIENNAYCASYFSPGLTVYFIGLYFTIMTLFHGGKKSPFFAQRKYCNGGKRRKKGINDIKWQTVSSRRALLHSKSFYSDVSFPTFFPWLRHSQGVSLTSFPYFVSCQPWRILPLSLVTISCTNIYTLWLSNFSILSCDGGASRNETSQWKKKSWYHFCFFFFTFLHFYVCR